MNNIVNRELSEIDKWLRVNRLFINYFKTKFSLFNRTAKMCDFSVTINDSVIEQSENITYLSVVLDEKLNWGGTFKISCFVMSKLRYYLDTNT